jgi:hypothetical protein
MMKLEGLECSNMGEQMFMLKSEKLSLSSVVSESPCSKCWPNILLKMKFAILELSCEFLQVSCTVLYEIIIVNLGSNKFFDQDGCQMCSWMQSKQGMALALTFDFVQ